MREESHTWQEIISQPDTWRLTIEGFNQHKRSLSDFLKGVNYQQILFTGCGSTHYLSQIAAAMASYYTGIPARAVPASDLYHFPQMVAPAGTMLVAISRSGTTSETIWALQQFREINGGPTVVITCHPDALLAQQAGFVLAAPDAQEQSIAQTRSFTSMLLLSQGLVSEMALESTIWEQTQRLPGALENIVEKAGDLPKLLGEKLAIDHMVFLGGGPLYGLANEAMLKIKEISLTNSEAYHPLELRHGPMSMVNNHTMVVGLLSDTGQKEQSHVLADMQKLGADTLTIVENSVSITAGESDYVIELQSGVNEWVRGPLYLPILQRVAYHRAIAKGLDPDCPTNLTAVVKLEKDHQQ